MRLNCGIRQDNYAVGDKSQDKTTTRYMTPQHGRFPLTRQSKRGTLRRVTRRLTDVHKTSVSAQVRRIRMARLARETWRIPHCDRLSSSTQSLVEHQQTKRQVEPHSDAPLRRRHVQLLPPDGDHRHRRGGFHSKWRLELNESLRCGQCRVTKTRSESSTLRVSQLRSQCCRQTMA